MNLTQLRLFRDIYREKSFARAARKNHMTQPAVSVHIKKLEHELGKTLFKRTPGDIRLTPEGQGILDDVKAILQLCEGLKIQSSLSRGELEGSIRVATIHSIGMFELGDFLTSFMNAYPRINVHLEFQRFDEIYELVLQDKVDLGIVAYPEKRTNIESHPLGSDELVLITAANHPMGSKKAVLLDKISNEPFIGFGEGIPTRIATDKLLADAGITVDFRMTNDNVYTLKKAVQAGIGIAIVPSRTVEEEVAQGNLARVLIKGADTTRPLALIRHRRAKMSKPLEVFIERLSAF